MKNILVILSLFLLAVSCKDTADPHSDKSNASLQHDTAKQNISTPAKRAEIAHTRKDSLHDVNADTLIALTVLKKNSTDVFEKFGLEFEGNCYACDLAEISIDKNVLTLLNTCDHNTQEKVTISTQHFADNQMTFETDKGTFIFTKENTLPIYALRVSGRSTKNKNLRIGQWFTLKHLLPKFKVHDCGDFEG
jgi:hypothetical protein